jgi:hypothetical protein
MKRQVYRIAVKLVVMVLPPQSGLLGERISIYFSPATQNQRYEIPWESEVRPPRELSTAEVQQQIQEKLQTEPGLANADIEVRTDDDSVVLIGRLANLCQRELALRIAQSYAGRRRIIDKLKIREAGCTAN